MRADLVPGGRFPDLTLPDHTGQKVTLSTLARNMPLVVTFYRGWW